MVELELTVQIINPRLHHDRADRINHNDGVGAELRDLLHERVLPPNLVSQKLRY